MTTQPRLLWPQDLRESSSGNVFSRVLDRGESCPTAELFAQPASMCAAAHTLPPIIDKEPNEPPASDGQLGGDQWLRDFENPGLEERARVSVQHVCANTWDANLMRFGPHGMGNDPMLREEPGPFSRLLQQAQMLRYQFA